MIGDYWVRGIALLLLMGALITGSIVTARHDEWGLAIAAILAVVGVGMAVLSLHERER